MSQVRLKRAYDAPSPDDGYRVLVDRLWPRGVKKETLRLDTWLKDIAPSPALRTWFGHDPAKWTEFARRYRKELESEPGKTALVALIERARKSPLTLVYAARDTEHNGAVVLAEMVNRSLAS